MQAAVVMYRLRAILLPFGEREFEICDLTSAGALRHQDRRIDENTAEIMRGVKALGCVPRHAIDVMF